MELLVWGLLMGMVAMVWFFAAATLMDRDQHREKPEAKNPIDTEHDDDAASFSTHNHHRAAA